MSRVVFLLWILVCAFAGFGQNATQGSLFASDAKGRELGACPLKSTTVKTDISGFLARVRVTQEFENSFSVPVEAVYVFPLSQNGAVDDMTMRIGERVIRGRAMRREEARNVYETAKSEGKTAALLDQERENSFTQSVANIMPGEKVVVEISYVETLKYEDGAYEFVFPMTVAPRYIPAGVKDAARITPPVARTRAGHDISIEVNLNAGVPVEEIRSTSHRIDQINLTASEAKVTLSSGKVIPNKDFILRYDVTGKRIEDAILTHRDERGGFFTLMLQPPDKIVTEDRTPKEIVFVLDTSGSMSGFPIEKAKEAMKLSLDGLYPEDTFNLITFAGDTEILFDAPVPATRANLDRAQAFLAERSGGGGTEMMKAIKAALNPSDSQQHVRIVCFMTDGEVGNDDEIIAEVQRHPMARVFSFGIGSSVNRSLLDKIAKEGRGEAEYVSLEDDGSKAAKKFYERVRTPLLTDLSIDWSGMPVADVYPTKLTDLFSAKPVIVHGRYTKGASGTIKLRGKVAGQPYEREIKFNLPETQTANDVLATLWARTRIDQLSSERLETAETPKIDEFDKQITNLGLEFGLLTSFTSFVAVEDRVVNQNGKPVTIQVPVERPEGTTDGDTPFRKLEIQANLSRPPAAKMVSGGGPGGGGGGGGRNAKSRAYKTWLKNSVAYTIGTGTGSGRGSGNGVGSGSASGTGSGDASSPPPRSVPSTQATVEVTSDEVVRVEASETTLSTTVSTRNIQQLPQTTSFNSLLRLSGARGYSNALQIDGADANENAFRIETNGSSSETNGRAGLVVRPDFPVGVKTPAEAAVDIEVDAFGNVISARASTGGLRLKKIAERAAMLSRFEPARVDNKPVRLKGTLLYRFARGKKVSVAIKQMKAVEPTSDELRAFAAAEKLHVWLYELVGQSKQPIRKPTANEAKFVQDGKAYVLIDLTSRSPEVIEKLKAAGLEIVKEYGTAGIVGRISPEKLVDVAEIAEVKLILPKI